MNLIRRLQQKLTSLSAHQQQALVVAFSGGVDSHVLLHCLHTLREQGEINNPLSAIHIHHGLSPHADSWLQHCQQICQAMNIPMQAARIHMQRHNRQSLEAEARHARYAKIAQLAPAQSLVLLAQHQDDQLETVLLQLKRGAGPKGLSGMAEFFDYRTELDPAKKLSFFRPLLSASQADIVDYARQHQLNWVEDESNLDVDFERNFLRHKVLPVLSHKWPELAKTAARSAQLCAEQQLLLEEVSLQKLAEVRAAANSLQVPPLLAMSCSWLQQIVRVWLSQQAIPVPSQAVLQTLKPELLTAKPDARPVIQWANWQFRRFDQRLFVLPVDKTILPHTLLWQGQGRLKLPEPLGLVLSQTSLSPEGQSESLLIDPDEGDVKIKFGGYAQRFKPQHETCSKPLKQWYKEWKIPPWQRDKIALFMQQQRPLALLVQGKWLLSQEHQLSLSSHHSHSYVGLKYTPK